MSVVTVKKSGLSSDLTKDLSIYFKTEDMNQPKLIAQESPNHPDEVACQVSFVPTFVKETATAGLEVESDGKPEAAEVENYGSKNLFIFLVDRSGSMSYNSRIDITKQALKLFLQSLPPGCQFQIISYGSNSFTMTKTNEGVNYDDETLR